MFYLDRTPFYAESGGQMGDTGTITTDTGAAAVLDTVSPLPGLHLHRVATEHGAIQVGQSADAHIDEERRAAIRRNHTATHVLHWALRKVLGEHVRQQGSLVGPDRLRFDFSHHSAVTDEELIRIEDLVNAEVLSNASVEHFRGVDGRGNRDGRDRVLRGEVRRGCEVLRAGEHSIELCGGTHVRALGDIGLVKILSEGSIGSNVRRVEAVTGHGSLALLRERDGRLRGIADTLGVPVEDLDAGLQKRLGELESVREEVRSLRRELADSASAQLAASAVDGRLVARVRVHQARRRA
ncbi:MAG: alanine--tRNA ligase-related protein [Microthrixaceae bacterium]|nr:alanine--tRNA ligase-related protein [Microthrixaceae bacterium]